MSSYIAKWHDYMKSGDLQALSAMLDENVVFESPVVHTPQRGKEITFKYLMAASKVLGGPEFTYLNEWNDVDSDILEFQNQIDGIMINGVDMIWWNDMGQIVRFKVMVRPLKAINLLHQMMGAQLTRG